MPPSRTRPSRNPRLAASTLALLSLAATLFFSALPAAAGTAPRVLLVGDSWAEFMWLNRTLRDVFADNGRPDLVEEGENTAISGSTAAEWATPSMLQLISDELDAHPSVDIVQLTVGGNDFLEGQPGGGWYAGMPQQEFDALVAQILGDLTTIVDHILAHDPALEVLISLYDYTNFEDGSALAGCPSRWEDLGEPTPRQINEAGAVLQNALTTVTDSRPRTSFVSHAGLMQFTFGFPDEGIPPGTLMPPGDLDRPSPIESMFLGLDCIHLSSDGYFAVGQNLWMNHYADFFDLGLLFADGFESGDASAWTASFP